MRITRLYLLASLLLSATRLWAAPQKCPDETTQVPATITGTLEYHPGAYAWYGVRLAQPVCGQPVIQAELDDRAEFREAHRYIGCKVTVTGDLFQPDTGYWSVPLGIADAHLRPVAACKPGQPLPDYSAIPIPASLHRYKVTAAFDPGTLTFSAQATDLASGKPLTPWQTYATDLGNAARDLQRMFCANGFLASDPRDIHNQPSLQANVDPDSPQDIEVAIPSQATVHLSFTCTRSNPGKQQ
ncbi:MAG TPA: hypothetical protein VME86_17015 [Acidobacteriaceae bacterium]|nr:hypothetical protein [Acidobacteriaceae bacterium]